MGIYDTIVLIVLGAAAFIGWRKGMVSQVASIVSVVASFMVASMFYERVAASIDAAEPWDRVAAFAICYLGTSLAVWLFFKQIGNSVKQLKLRDFDRQLGAVLGAAKGVVIVTVLTLIAVNLMTAGPRDAIAQSRSGFVVSRIVHTVGPRLPLRFQELLANYVQQLDELIGQPPGEDPYGPYQVDGGQPTYDDRYPSRPSDPYPNSPYSGYPQNSQYVPPTYLPPNGRR